MPFLRINGWPVHVASNQSSRSVVAQGRRGRSFRGQLRDTRRFTREAWDIQTIFAEHEDAYALQQLLLGRGHFFDFADGLQASTSLMPEFLAPGTVIDPFATGAFGFPGGLTFLDTAADAVLIVDAQLGDEWTVLARVFNDGSGLWDGYGWRSDGATFAVGARDDLKGKPLSLGGRGMRPVVISGIMHVIKETAAFERFDDLMILPWRASDSMLASFTAATGAAVKFAALPELVIDGDLLDSFDAPIVQAEVGDIDILQGRSSIPGRGWVNNARVLRFKLLALQPSFRAA